MFSDSSSIMGDRWYDNNKKGIDFKFEVNSAVDSIEFPMNQNLNLKLDSKSVDGDLNLQIQNDDVPKCQEQKIIAKSDIKTTLNVQKFTLSNVKPFDQLLDLESSENDNS